ncbi:GNAT family N-acetyltransferase [Paenibacillus kobensis]|uniref:GNAT family N-acetyltransferase n=1 Tax=Paenibacillus kobensis TaxID=59841 RepID=UPI000FD7FA2D|nr:GNAT family N-acetyltransferase [Paenibacillus kobensis]
MSATLPSIELANEIERSEIEYMTDRMTAIQSRPDNPEGIEIETFGNAVALYSRTMPWATFNTVKGLTDRDIDYIEPILEFYRQRDRKVQFEIIPSLTDHSVLNRLSELGLYQAGFHCSLVAQPSVLESSRDTIRIEELPEDQFEQYATIHCRGTGLPDDGIPYVAQNNKVLHGRPGWKFYIAYVNESPAAVSVMYIQSEKASLTFAATLPQFRNLGLHQQLLQRRITDAYHSGCRLVVGQCAFLSQSHRNMESAGMKLGYVRTSWTEK